MPARGASGTPSPPPSTTSQQPRPVRDAVASCAVAPRPRRACQRGQHRHGITSRTGTRIDGGAAGRPPRPPTCRDPRPSAARRPGAAPSRPSPRSRRPAGYVAGRRPPHRGTSAQPSPATRPRPASRAPSDVGRAASPPSRPRARPARRRRRGVPAGPAAPDSAASRGSRAPRPPAATASRPAMGRASVPAGRGRRLTSAFAEGTVALGDGSGRTEGAARRSRCSASPMARPPSGGLPSAWRRGRRRPASSAACALRSCLTRLKPRNTTAAISRTKITKAVHPALTSSGSGALGRADERESARTQAAPCAPLSQAGVA